MLVDEDLDVDVVVVGTGLVESIVAASLARAGKKILHVDDRNYFGANSCSLSWNQLIDWADSTEAFRDEVCTGSNSELIFASGDQGQRLFYDRRFTILQNGIGESEFRSNDFAIDICPRLLYSRCDVVDVLCRSGVGKYLEFQIASSSEVYHADQFHSVPLSKTDIFNHPSLELLQKRLLMKFLNKLIPNSVGTSSIAFRRASASGVARMPRDVDSMVEGNLPQASNDDLDSFPSFVSKFKCPWHVTIQQERLHGVLVDMVVFAICMSDWRQDDCCSKMPQMTTIEGLRRVQHFMMSLGRYGSHAMLYPMYGAADIAQAFTRSCAVHNGIYMLSAQPSKLFHKSSCSNQRSISGLQLTNGQEVKCSHVVCNPDYVPTSSSMAQHSDSGTARSIKGILISTSNVLTSRELALGFIPSLAVSSGSGGSSLCNVIHVLQVHDGTGCAPKNHFVTYFCQARFDDDKTDIDNAIHHFADKIGHANVLAHGSFVHCARFDNISTCVVDAPNSPPSVFDSLCKSHRVVVVPDPVVTPQLSLSIEVQQARSAFERIMGTPGVFFVSSCDVEHGNDGGLMSQFTNDLVSAASSAGAGMR